MGQTVETYRWSVSEFLRAWEAGAFDHRVELIEGEVWPVVIGRWHGEMVAQVIALLKQSNGKVTTATLPSGNSLPDPDCWVHRDDATPVGAVGSKLDRWDPLDVLLVVEIADDTLMADLNIKAKIYGGAGWPVYWVVSPDAIYVHTEPSEDGYLQRATYRRGTRVPIRYAGIEVAVDEVLGPEPRP